MARPWCLPAPLGSEVEKPSILGIPNLREEKATPIPEMRIVGSELMAVIAQGERLLEATGQRTEATEMIDPFLIGKGIESNPPRPALVAVAEDVLRESRRFHNIVEGRSKFLMML
jgi:hypothetical protein